MAPQQELQLNVSTHGPVPDHSRQRVEEKLAQLVGLIREPVLFAEARLIAETNPARERPAVAEATLDINGTPLRAHVASIDMDAAVDLLEERLKRRLTRHEGRLHRDGKERRSIQHDPGDGEWRHGDLPTHRPEWFDRPVDERELIRHKTFALEPMTVDEASFDLDALAHDFYLFTEINTGADSVVSFDHDHAVVLQQPEGAEGDPTTGCAVPVELAPPAPRLSLDDARDRLDDGGERWVFFVDDETGRGHVVYHRYDGHYGLITPAT